METKNKIREFIIENLLTVKNASWDDATDIVATGVLDSLSLVKLMLFIEENFNISIDLSEDLVQFKSLNSITELVQKKCS